MAETHPAYWKVKAAFYETRTAVLEARQAIARADAKYGAVMIAAGLDPSLNYNLDDATESITLQSAPSTTPPVRKSP